MTPRILLVSELFPPAVGGSAALLANIYGRLDGFPVTVMSDPARSGGSGTPIAQSSRTWTSINGRLRGLRSPAEIEQVWRIARAIRQNWRADANVVVHAARPLPEGLPALVAKSMGVTGPRYACWVHGEDLAVAMTSREHKFLAGIVCRNASMMLCSNGFAARLVASLGVPEDRIRVVHPGVDIERFHPAVDGEAERKHLKGHPILLTVGRLQRRKGHDTTIRAVALLKNKFPRILYVIAGIGEEQARLAQLTKDLAVQPHVVFAGPVGEERLPHLYAACDLFVMPTRQDGRDVEGFGIVYLEAAATGRATIGGNNGGVPEAVEDGTTGLLVSGEDPAELADKLDLLLSDNEQRLRMGAAGRDRVCERFTWEHGARLISEIQEGLC